MNMLKHFFLDYVRITNPYSDGANFSEILERWRRAASRNEKASLVVLTREAFLYTALARRSLRKLS